MGERGRHQRVAIVEAPLEVRARAPAQVRVAVVVEAGRERSVAEGLERITARVGGRSVDFPDIGPNPRSPGPSGVEPTARAVPASFTAVAFQYESGGRLVRCSSGKPDWPAFLARSSYRLSAFGKPVHKSRSAAPPPGELANHTKSGIEAPARSTLWVVNPVAPGARSAYPTSLSSGPGGHLPGADRDPAGPVDDEVKQVHEPPGVRQVDGLRRPEGTVPPGPRV